MNRGPATRPRNGLAQAQRELVALLTIPEPVVYVSCDEQQALLSRSEALARQALGKSTHVHSWALDSPEPLEAALEAVESTTGPNLTILRDSSPFADPRLARRLLALAERLADSQTRVLLLGQQRHPPELLRTEVPSLRWPGADPRRLTQLTAEALKQAGLDTRYAATLARSLSGLGEQRARATLRRSIVRAGRSEVELVQQLFNSRLEREEGGQALEFHPVGVGLGDIGGMACFKSWAEKRSSGSGSGSDAVLLVGVPGCGKSLACKALGPAWRQPVYRLDMARVFAASTDGPEAMFVRALEAVTRLAPATLWVDELETALGGGGDRSGAAMRIYSSFLTWLQERPAGVFVAATANRIELLPPELLRKGRFDRLFFVDLPDEEERKEIFEIHLRRGGHPVANFDLILLAKGTQGWSGSELEAAIRETGARAADSGELLDQRRLLREIGQQVPLSQTMEAAVRKLREWAHNRALHASYGRF